jgi:hypothetical protein
MFRNKLSSEVAFIWFEILLHGQLPHKDCAYYYQIEKSRQKRNTNQSF